MVENVLPLNLYLCLIVLKLSLVTGLSTTYLHQSRFLEGPCTEADEPECTFACKFLDFSRDGHCEEGKCMCTSYDKIPKW